MTTVISSVTEEATFAYFQLDGGLFRGGEHFIDVGDVLLDGVVLYIFTSSRYIKPFSS